LPAGHADVSPDDVKIRGDPGITLGRRDSTTLRQVDGTHTTDILIDADVILAFAPANNDDRESCLPEPSTG
jgi:hypothetical protein